MRWAVRLAHAVRGQLLRLLRWRTHGVKLLAIDDNGRVLLVRHSYGSGRWMLPGGGIKRSEPAAEAARRELREEVGLSCAELSEFGRYELRTEGKRDDVTLFVATISGMPKADGREVLEAALFAPDALPTQASPATLRWMPNGAAWRRSLRTGD